MRHSAYVVQRAHKAAALGRILDVESPTAALVFCRTRDAVDTLTETLNGRGYRSEALHGGMSQEQRDRVMGRLRSGTADLLIATDVAARGLDIEQLSHVINYDVPSSVDTYVHRMGRVGRAGREGVAITLAEPREHRMLKTIERATKHKITVEKIPTVADLRERRLDLTRAALRESLLDDDLDGFRVVVESLAEEFDVMEVALAAVKLAHAAIGGPDDEEDIPDVVVSAPPRDKSEPWPPRPEPAGRCGRWARDDSALRQPRTRGGPAAPRPRRGDHGRDKPEWAQHRRHRDLRALLPRRRARRRRRRGDRGATQHQNPRQAGHGAPGALLGERRRTVAGQFDVARVEPTQHDGTTTASVTPSVVVSRFRRRRRRVTGWDGELFSVALRDSWGRLLTDGLSSGSRMLGPPITNTNTA